MQVERNTTNQGQWRAKEEEMEENERQLEENEETRTKKETKLTPTPCVVRGKGGKVMDNLVTDQHWQQSELSGVWWP